MSTPLDPAVRDLLAAIADALERGPEGQRFRVAAALHDWPEAGEQP
jgi:hypothetical protein